ncbi:MAG: hypothetical protein PHS54_04510 [Clostridia bacterium]|nr:hypothetical protein [Clostridia bacterium]
MLNSNSEKRVFKKNLRRRVIEVLISIPFGIGFATLFWWINLSYGLQLFLTIVCWGAVIGLMELGFWLFSKNIKKKNKDKPRDPFAD